MIQKTHTFALSQRRYLLIFAALCIVYGLLMNRIRPEDAARPSESPQYQAFKHAEEQFQINLNGKEGSFEALFRREPVATGLFLGCSGLFGILFIGGCVLLLLFVTSKKFKTRWIRVYPLEEKPWSAAVLLRVVVHFLAISLVLNGFLSAAVWLFPGINPNALALVHTSLVDAASALIILREIGFSWRSIREFGFDLKGRSAWGEAFFGLCGYMAVIPFFALVLFILITITQMLSYEPEPHPLVDVFLSDEKRDHWMITFSVFLACLWGPFFEEIFFRGLCYPVFKKLIGALPGGVLSAVFFALIHHNEFAFLPIFLLGLGLVLLYEKRGNLVAPIFLHIFHNSLFISYFFAAKALIGSR